MCDHWRREQGERLMGSRLPITIRPAGHEIAVSYLARLATLHGTPFDELWAQVIRPRQRTGGTRRLEGDLLARSPTNPAPCWSAR
jgi:hypothetical protein